MDVPSKCTIVRAIGRSVYGLETTKKSVVGTEATLSVMRKTHKRKTVFHVHKASYKTP